MFVIDRLLSRVTSDCALALTGDTLWVVSAKEGAVPVAVPALAAHQDTDEESTEYEYVGQSVLDMSGRTPTPLQVVSALREGWIHHAAAARAVLAQGLAMGAGKDAPWIGPRVLATARFHASGLMETSLKRFICGAGARKALLLNYPLACGLGMGLELSEPSIQAVLAIEEDWFAFAVLSSYGILTESSVALGMAGFVDDARCHFRDTKDLLLDKKELRAHLRDKGISSSGMIPGWEAWASRPETGRATEASLTPDELTLAITPTLVRIAEEVKSRLLDISPDQLDELRKSGIHLCGCGAELPGLGALLSERTGVTVHSRPDEVHPAICGLAGVLSDLDTIGPVLENAVR